MEEENVGDHVWSYFSGPGREREIDSPAGGSGESTGFADGICHPTAPVKDSFKSLPPCYKVDIADPARMLAIEVDGRTHGTKKWQFLDKRKTDVLNALGWSVLRFSNERVDSDLEAVLREIREFSAQK